MPRKKMDFMTVHKKIYNRSKKDPKTGLYYYEIGVGWAAYLLNILGPFIQEEDMNHLKDSIYQDQYRTVPFPNLREQQNDDVLHILKYKYGLCTVQTGYGKTEVIATLANYFSTDLGKKVLIVDLDSQANSTEGSGVEPSNTIYDVFAETCSIKESITQLNLYDLVCADERLAILEQMESSEIDPNLLKDKLAEVKKEYDFIIIDTPPALGNLLQLSLVASDYVIVPCEPRPFALNRIDSFYETIKATNKKLKVLGLLLVKYNDRATLNKQIRIALETKARLMNTQTFKTYIRDGIAVGESQTVQQPLIEYAPKSKPSIDYMDFTEEVLQRLEVKKK